MLFFITHSCGFGNCYTHFYGAEEEISYLVLLTANGHLRFHSGFLIYFFIFEPKVCFTSVFKNVKDRERQKNIFCIRFTCDGTGVGAGLSVLSFDMRELENGHWSHLVILL